MKWFRVVLTALLLAQVATVGLLSPGPVQAAGISVELDGYILEFDVSPRMYGNRVLVPLRGIVEAIGADVHWDPGPAVASVYRTDQTVTIRAGASVAISNGYLVDIDVPAVVTDGRMMVPVRFLTGALGLTVHWDPLSLTVAVRSGDASAVESAELPVVGTIDRLRELVRHRELQGGLKQTRFDVSVPREAMASEPEADYSDTNVQVDGVDEADVVKTDGTYIYLVSRGRVVIVRARPWTDMAVVGTVGFDDDRFQAKELFVDDRHLVVIGISNHLVPLPRPGFGLPDHDAYRFQSLVRVLVYDVSDPGAATLIRTVELEGSYRTSRKIDSALYVVATQPLWADRVLTGNAAATPGVRDSAGSGELEPISLEQVRYVPGSSASSYLLVAGLDLDTGDPASVEACLGAGDNVYASHDNLYAAVTSYRGRWWAPAGEETEIYRFRLAGGRVTIDGQGRVPGRIVNQFAMDEHEGYFRIATTTGEFWWNPEQSSRNHLFILDRDLNRVAAVEDIAPGERIYSTRFFGDRAYMVTFRTVDPLFVIDLDPEQPRLLGELKIPGYSTYLHPMGRDHLIGFGRETMELAIKDHRGQVVGFNVIDLGIKLSLFDVSDVTSPVERDVMEIGGRGTWSPLLYDHRALLYDGRRGLMAFPVAVTRNDAGDAGYGEPVFQGAYVVDVSTAGFELRGKISHGDDIMKSGRYWLPHDRFVERVLYIGDVLYTMSEALVRASDIEDLRELNTIRLP